MKREKKTNLSKNVGSFNIIINYTPKCDDVFHTLCVWIHIRLYLYIHKFTYTYRICIYVGTDRIHVPNIETSNTEFDTQIFTNARFTHIQYIRTTIHGGQQTRNSILTFMLMNISANVYIIYYIMCL